MKTDAAYVWTCLRPRPRDSHKGTFGAVLAVAGSASYRGAAALAVEGALRTGAGIVTLASVEPVLAAVSARLPECCLCPCEAGAEGGIAPESIPRIQRQKATVLLLGPGLGYTAQSMARAAETRTLVQTLLPGFAGSAVLDADGLNAAARLLAEEAAFPHPAGELIVTPHPGEMARLTGLSAAQINADREGTALRYAQAWNAVVVLKGARTVVAAPDGRVRVNPTGNPGLSRGGSGDVLAGMTSALLACAMARRGYHCGILDADITGPSIPKLFGIHGRAMADDKGCWPIQSRMGIDVMSINLLVENEEDPVVWRGPVIAGAVKQFWTDVVWKDVDFLFVDMPPGTGDVPLTVFQSLPVDGIVIVTSPQELVSMIVGKAVRMAQMMNIPILGIIENMSYVECPDCGKQIHIFGESHVDEVAKQYNLPVLGRIPMTAEIAAASDAGNVEELQGNWFDDAVAAIEKLS